MLQVRVGYGFLVEHYGLRARPLAQYARIEAAAKGRQLRRMGDQQVLVLAPDYQPEPTLAGHLQFALRYEGINLEVLALLFRSVAFAQNGQVELEQWLAASPESRFARRAGFLYEWLTGNALQATVPAKAAYVPVVDDKLQFCSLPGVRNSKFRVLDNLPGTRDFCPLVSKTDFLMQHGGESLRQLTASTLAQYDADLLRRAAAFLYLKETQSSFELEREKPSASKAQRFADLLRQAEVGQPLTEARFAELQNAVVDPRFHEFHWRQEQNWIGQDLGVRKKMDFVPPRPEDVPSLMEGLLAMAERTRERWRQDAAGAPDDAVIMAAMVAFGFVFIHPFMDGNGRLHRYLIHELLAAAGFTPRGIVLPVSAVILANLDEYVAVLEQFSRPVLALTDYDPEMPAIAATGNDAIYYRYFDATPQAEFLCRALLRTVQEDLVQEIDTLLGFDRARQGLNPLLDWPAHALDLFVQCIRQNDGRLSNTKRQSHFSWMTEAEIEAAEAIVHEAFARKEPHT